MLGTNGLFIFGIFKHVIGGQQFGDKPMSNTGLIIASALTILFTFLFLKFSLKTIIRTDGIYVRFFPFHTSFRHYSWSSISKAYVRQYSPFREYGGWGLRMSLFGKGQAFNISGNKGLQLEFTNGDKLLIGTKKPDELTEVLNNIGQLKH